MNLIPLLKLFAGSWLAIFLIASVIILIYESTEHTGDTLLQAIGITVFFSSALWAFGWLCVLAFWLLTSC